MTGRLAVLLKKLSIPFLLLLAGLIMLIVGISQSQDGMFMLSAFMMLVAGGISILYSSGKLNPKIATLIGLVAGVGAIIILFISWKSVRDTDRYNRNYDKCKMIAKQNLEDVRYIQKAYAEQYGVYLTDWNSLIDFTNNGTVPYVDAQGVVPKRKILPEERDYLYGDNRAIDNDMTEDEAYRLSKWMEGPNYTEFANFKRDTIQVSLLESKFKSRSYVENREKMGFYKFNPDSLPYIPYTNQKWSLETKDSILVGDAKYPALYIYGKIPFADVQGKNNDTEEMFFGSLTTPDLDGSWEGE